MLAFYLMVLIVIGMVLYAGYEGTMRVFVYLDLSLRYAWVKFRMYLMARKLKSQLLSETAEYKNLIKEIKDGSGMWTQEAFSALIDEFNRLRNGAGAPPWAKPKRCAEQADESVFGDLRWSPPVRFDEW